MNDEEKQDLEKYVFLKRKDLATYIYLEKMCKSQIVKTKYLQKMIKRLRKQLKECNVSE